MKKRNKLNNKGFSLVELIIVMAIMAILVGAVTPQVIKYVEKSRETKDLQVLQTVFTAAQTAIMTDEEALKDGVSITLTALFAKTTGIKPVETDMMELLGEDLSLKLASKKATDASKSIYISYDKDSRVLEVGIGTGTGTNEKGKGIGPINN